MNKSSYLKDFKKPDPDKMRNRPHHEARKLKRKYKGKYVIKPIRDIYGEFQHYYICKIVNVYFSGFSHMIVLVTKDQKKHTMERGVKIGTEQDIKALRIQAIKHQEIKL